MPRPPQPRRKSLLCPLSRRLGGSQSRSCFGAEKNLLRVTGIELKFFGSSAQSLQRLTLEIQLMISQKAKDLTNFY